MDTITTDYGFGAEVTAEEIAERLEYEGIEFNGFDVFVREIAGAGYFTDLDSAVAAYHDAVIGNSWDSLTDYAWHYAEDCLGLDGFALDYFDAEKFGRDLELGGDVVTATDADYGLWLFYGGGW